MSGSANRAPHNTDKKADPSGSVFHLSKQTPDDYANCNCASNAARTSDGKDTQLIRLLSII
jgi:hypothetical protein